MSKKNIILAITNGFWLIDRQYAEANAGLIHKVLSGDFAFESKENIDKPQQDDADNVKAFSVDILGAVSFGSKYNPFESAQPGSTAVISISGPIMKYDNCGDPGTKSYAFILNKADKNPNINSIVIIADSPGGTVDGTQELADYIKNLSKPVVTLVDGLAASAMYWIASSSSEIIALNDTSMIGSIGTMISFADMQPYYESLGVKFHYITADASVDKNKDYLEARKGNYDLIKQKLNDINDVFLSSVKENRAGKIDLKKENVLTGKVYLASDAMKFGLIDAIGNLDFAVERAQALAADKMNSNNSNKQNNSAQNSSENLENKNMKKLTLNASHVALLAVFGASIAEGQSSVDVELTDANLTAIEAALAASSKASSDLAEANTKVTSLTAKVGELGAEIVGLNAKVTELGAANPGATVTGKKGDDSFSEDAEEKEETTAADTALAAMKAKMGIA